MDPAGGPAGATAVRPTPLWARATTSLRRPAFWLVLLLVVAGAWRVAVILGDGFRIYPVATTVAIGLFALYAIPFWLFVDNVDYLEREPPLLLLTAFAWGGLVATSTAIPGNAAITNLLAKQVSTGFAASWGPAIAGPTTEEILKTLGIVAVVLIARAQVNSVLDGVVYGALVGLGFQVVENMIYAVNAVGAAGAGDQVGPVVTTFFLRGFLAGLWSHTLFSALAGAGVAYVVVRIDRPLWLRAGVAGGALVGAWLCHFLWNSPLLADGFGYGTLGVFGALLLKGIPPLLLVLLMVRHTRGREAEYYVGHLAVLNDPGIATPAELRILGSGRQRAEARRYAHGRAGIRGRAAVRRLQLAQARLAVELSRAAPSGIGPSVDGAGLYATGDVARRFREVRTQRRRLLALGHPEAVASPRAQPAWQRWLTSLGTATVVVVALAVAIGALGGG